MELDSRSTSFGQGECRDTRHERERVRWGDTSSSHGWWAANNHQEKNQQGRFGGQNRVTSAQTMSGLRDWIWGSLGITENGGCLVSGGGVRPRHLPRAGERTRERELRAVRGAPGCGGLQTWREPPGGRGAADGTCQGDGGGPPRRRKSRRFQENVTPREGSHWTIEKLENTSGPRRQGAERQKPVLSSLGTLLN